jgi:sulfur-carrier protein
MIMPQINFTPNLMRHIDIAPTKVQGTTVAEVLAAIFDHEPRLRSYVLDDQGALRKHVAIFIDSERIVDPVGFSDVVGESSEIFIMQALSGG